MDRRVLLRHLDNAVHGRMNAAMIGKEPDGAVGIAITIPLVQHNAVRPRYLNPAF